MEKQLNFGSECGSLSVTENVVHTAGIWATERVSLADRSPSASLRPYFSDRLSSPSLESPHKKATETSAKKLGPNSLRTEVA